MPGPQSSPRSGLDEALNNGLTLWAGILRFRNTNRIVAGLNLRGSALEGFSASGSDLAEVLQDISRQYYAELHGTAAEPQQGDMILSASFESVLVEGDYRLTASRMARGTKIQGIEIQISHRGENTRTCAENFWAAYKNLYHLLYSMSTVGVY